MSGYSRCKDIEYIIGREEVLDYILDVWLCDDDMQNLADNLIKEFNITDEELSE